MKLHLDHGRISLSSGLLAVLCMGAAVLDGARLERFFSTPGDFMSWLALAVLVSLFSIPRSRNRSPLSIQPGVDLAAVFVFGPGVAAWIALFSRVVSNVGYGWKHPDSIWRLSRGVLTVTVTGWTYLLIGGPVGVNMIEMPGGISYVLTAGLLYLILDFGFVLLGDAFDFAKRAARPMASILRNEILVYGPVLAGGILLGVLRLHLGPLSMVPFALLVALAGHATAVLDKKRQGHRETIRTLMAAVDAADPATRGHSYRIAKVCTRVARHMGLSEVEIGKLEHAALLHDIGRTALQHDLLAKPGKLTREEHFAVRTHPRIGSEMVKAFDLEADTERVVLSHHEQPDGKGYPAGLQGEDIPPGSRIIMAVAAFDAMTSDRPYRRGLEPEAAFEELLNCSGTQFFADVVEALISLYSKGALYEEFEDRELEDYWDGRSNSRALDKYLHESDRNLDIPQKLGMVKDDGTSDDGVPVIEFPDSGGGVSISRFRLDSEGKFKLAVAGRTDVGCVRDNNEDNLTVVAGEDPEQGVLVLVADGMGGAAAGEVASKMAVDSTREDFFRNRAQFDPGEALSRSIIFANREIHAKAYEDPELEGMGTTLTAVVFVGSEAVIGHVGDSRAYLVSGESIEMLSRDHTLAAELVAIGGSKIDIPSGASNVLSRCLGGTEEVEVDVSEEPLTLKDGDTFVLCSDGLSNMVGAEEMLEIVVQNEPEVSANRLVELARSRGGPDNITVQIARIEFA